MQKRVKMALATVMIAFCNMGFATTSATLELQKRLAKVTQYRADFEQTVRSSQGKEIQKGQGKFQVKRPNLFRLETNTPQQNIIVSDGETLWFYDPFVAQATANRLKDAVDNTPFVLLTGNTPAHWDNYVVSQSADNFTLKPKSSKSAIKQFDVRIDEHGILKGFSTIERDGQSNLYLLRNINNSPLADEMFQFSLPKGAELDDQRR